jgi:hypothetical protein
MGIVSPLVLYKGILDVLEVSLVFRVSEKEKRRILAQSVYYLHLLLPRGLAYQCLRQFRWGCILSF